LFFLNLFRLDLYRTLTRQTEAPIGTITFKYRAAQRRFADRALWDRLKRESPVYEGDVIRTAELSEATVTFAGGDAVINLAENSLIQLHEDDRGLSVDFDKGGVSAGAGDAPLTLVAGDRRITVEPGGMAQLGTENGELTLRVMEGTASLAGADGTAGVAAGETLALGGAGPRALREAAALFPRPQARFLNPGPGTFAVPFPWTATPKGITAGPYRAWPRRAFGIPGGRESHRRGGTQGEPAHPLFLGRRRGRLRVSVCP
jgi:hypothetical protein